MLSRDQILSMTSKEIEEYVSAIKTKRVLTAAEEKDLKKQRRLEHTLAITQFCAFYPYFSIESLKLY